MEPFKLQNSHSGPKSLEAFQSELFYLSSPKQKRKDQSKKHRNRNFKLPSLYDEKSPNYSPIPDNDKSKLIKKIEEFESRIRQYEKQNRIEQEAEKRIQSLIKKLPNQNMRNDGYERNMPTRSQYISQYNQPQMQGYPYQMYPFPSNQQQSFSPQFYPNQYNQYNPYPMSHHQNYSQPLKINNPHLHPYNNTKKSRLSPQMKKKLLRKFRIIAIAVYFSVLFPKYSKSVTHMRFSEFKLLYSKASYIQKIKRQIYLLLKSQIKEKFSEDIEETKNMEFSIRNKNSTVNQKALTIFLQVDNFVKILTETMNKIEKIIKSKSFQRFIPYFRHCLSIEFIPSSMFTIKELKFLNLHKKKGYSQIKEKVEKYLLLISLIFECLVLPRTFQVAQQEKVLQLLGQQELQNLAISISLKRQVLSLLVTTEIENIEKSLSVYSLPNSEILPYPNKSMNSFSKSWKNLETEQRQIFINHEELNKNNDLFKKQVYKQFRKTSENIISVLYAKIKENRQAHFSNIKKRVLNTKLIHEQSDNFFHRMSQDDGKNYSSGSSNEDQDESEEKQFSQEEEYEEDSQASQQESEVSSSQSENSSNKE